MIRKNWLPFEEAREYIRGLNLKSQKEWHGYRKSGNKPKNIPADPSVTYKEWISWGDWLGTGFIFTQYIEFIPFEQAREFVRNLKLKSEKEWFAYSKSGNKPENIPSTPRISYKNKGWIGFGDWLGTGATCNSYKNFLSFEKAREFAQSLNLKSSTEWFIYSKSGEKPHNIPACPRITYKNKGWTNFGDWLGTGNISTRNIAYIRKSKKQYTKIQKEFLKLISK